MRYTLCHVADSFAGMDKNSPKKSPAGTACRGRAAMRGRPPLFRRSAPSALRPAPHRKTSRLQIYRTNVAQTSFTNATLYFIAENIRRWIFATLMPLVIAEPMRGNDVFP